jgi:hypothetical protein
MKVYNSRIKLKLNTIGLFTIVIFCLINIINLQKKQINISNNTFSIKDYLKQEQIDKANLNILQIMPSFGFKNLIADLGYLQFLQYFGDSEAREQIGYSLSPEYFETVVNNDPRFVRAYFLMSPATSIFAGYPEKSISLIDQGLSQITPDIHSQSYYLWLYKATDELLFLGDINSAKKSYEIAAQWAEQSTNLNAQRSAENIRQTARFLADDPDSTIARIGAWTMVLSSTSDLKTQQKAIEEIKALGGQVVITPEGALNVKVPG